MANHKKKLILATLLTSIFIISGVFAYSHFGEAPTRSDDEPAKTTSTEPSAQEDFNLEDIGAADSNERKAGNTIREDQGSADISDNQGSIDSSVSVSNPIKSPTGEIIVFSPTKDSLVNNKILVAGESTLDSVRYRISDSISGVISSGQLNVVDGKFSGTLTVETGAELGRLDLYGTRQNGNEFSNISIPLRFR